MTQKIDPQTVVLPTSVDPTIANTIDAYVKWMRLEHWEDERGILRPQGQSSDCFLRCSKGSIDFAAEKFKEILSALVANGCEVEFESTQENSYSKPTQKVVVKLGQASRELRIEEAATRVERKLTASERKEKERKEATGGYFYFYKRWIYTPTGKPKLVYDTWNSRVIGDDVRPLVALVIDELNERNDYARREEIDRRRARAKYLARLRRFRRKLWRERQFEAIEKEAKNWARAEKLRRYIASVEALKDEYVVDEWLAMAKQLVNDLDPIASETFATIVSLPSYAEVERVWQERNKKRYGYDY